VRVGNQNVRVIDGVTQQIYIAEDYIQSGASQDQLASLLEHEAVHAILNAASSALATVSTYLAQTSAAREHSIICGGLGYTGCNLCDPGSDQCETCAPAAMALKKTFGCFRSAIETSELPPVAPITRLINPTMDQTSSAWASCFAAMDHGTAPPPDPVCTLVHCADQSLARLIDDACSCTTPPSGVVPALYDHCLQAIMCAPEGNPVAIPGGGCKCSAVGAALTDGQSIVP
jgi:hypothetical protein